MSTELYLAQKLYEAGDPVAAEEACQPLLTQGRTKSGANFLLAQISYDRGDYQASLRFLNASETDAADSEAYLHLEALNRFALDDYAGARVCYEKIVNIDESNADAHRNLGLIAQAQRDITAAATSYCRALELTPADDLTRRSLIDCLGTIDWQRIRRTPLYDTVCEHLRTGIAPSELSVKTHLWTAATAVLWSESFQATLAVATNTPDQELPRLERSLYDPLAQDRLFHQLLRSEIIPFAAFERVLTYLRRYSLESAIDGDEAVSQAGLELTVAMAHQFYLTEYVAPISDTERALVAQIQDLTHNRIATADTFGPLDALRVAVAACYAALGDWLDDIPTSLNDGVLASLAEVQIVEPREQRALAREIMRGTPVSDLTSATVQAQYEENPFPRWNILAKPRPSTVAGRLRSIFPDFQPPEILENPCKILIAGSGTGHQPITEALLYPDCLLTALELSIASLAYAQRKARQYEVRNIEFRQGDILDVRDLNQEFDVIECTGVLHHMADPLAGWRALFSCLAPGGVMKIALYSERARRHLTAVQTQIAENHLTPEPETIRQFRHSLLDLPETDPHRDVIGFSDFFSLSGVRDLLFHAQECTYTIPKIHDEMVELGLELIGFQLGEPTIEEKYRAMFPDDPAMTNFECWEKFETTHPDTFRQMYVFWCQQAAVEQ